MQNRLNMWNGLILVATLVSPFVRIAQADDLLLLKDATPEHRLEARALENLKHGNTSENTLHRQTLSTEVVRQLRERKHQVDQETQIEERPLLARQEQRKAFAAKAKRFFQVDIIAKSIASLLGKDSNALVNTTAALDSPTCLAQVDEPLIVDAFDGLARSSNFENQRSEKMKVLLRGSTPTVRIQQAIERSQFSALKVLMAEFPVETEKVLKAMPEESPSTSWSGKLLERATQGPNRSPLAKEMAKRAVSEHLKNYSIDAALGSALQNEKLWVAASLLERDHGRGISYLEKIISKPDFPTNWAGRLMSHLAEEGYWDLVEALAERDPRSRRQASARLEDHQELGRIAKSKAPGGTLVKLARLEGAFSKEDVSDFIQKGLWDVVAATFETHPLARLKDHPELHQSAEGRAFLTRIATQLAKDVHLVPTSQDLDGFAQLLKYVPKDPALTRNLFIAHGIAARNDGQAIKRIAAHAPQLLRSRDGRGKIAAHKAVESDSDLAFEQIVTLDPASLRVTDNQGITAAEYAARLFEKDFKHFEGAYDQIQAEGYYPTGSKFEAKISILLEVLPHLPEARKAEMNSLLSQVDPRLVGAIVSSKLSSFGPQNQSQINALLGILGPKAASVLDSKKVGPHGLEILTKLGHWDLALALVTQGDDQTGAEFMTSLALDQDNEAVALELLKNGPFGHRILDKALTLKRERVLEHILRTNPEAVTAQGGGGAMGRLLNQNDEARIEILLRGMSPENAMSTLLERSFDPGYHYPPRKLMTTLTPIVARILGPTAGEALAAHCSKLAWMECCLEVPHALAMANQWDAYSKFTARMPKEKKAILQDDITEAALRSGQTEIFKNHLKSLWAPMIFRKTQGNPSMFEILVSHEDETSIQAILMGDRINLDDRGKINARLLTKLEKLLSDFDPQTRASWMQKFRSW